ncbi:hypothetical protein GP486_004044 [Trichoglossum hirsutum]|uniref:G domain-containing protein n=1 Tax=Trichoglossum hirsutum TaxID=265104 RepID=A0A9P8RPS7_9PEZI|nr:hypothetical protein GP486_004044 [Trichoglossum hirsutum]
MDDSLTQQNYINTAIWILGTSSVTMHTIEHSGRKVHLIDTPGFDDTYRPLADTLHEIAFWLTKAYKLDIKLSGIVYLHNISTPRLHGSGMKSLSLFKKMCGVQSFSGIVLATTMWHTVSQDVGNARQRELANTPRFWGEMKSAESLIYAHSAGRTSAMAIINHIVIKDRRLVLDIQREMVDEGKPTNETGAGREFIQISVEEVRNLERQMGELLRESRAIVKQNRGRNGAALRSEYRQIKEDIRTRNRSIESIHTSLDQLHEEWEQRIKDEMASLERETSDIKQRINLKRQEVELAKKEYQAKLKNSAHAQKVAKRTDVSLRHNPTTAYPAAADEDFLLRYQAEAIAQERELQALIRQRSDYRMLQERKIAAFDMFLSTAGVTFGGISAGATLLPLVGACVIM